MIAYLKTNYNARLEFDPTYPVIDINQFDKKNLITLYGNIREGIPKNASQARGKNCIMVVFVNEDHVGDLITRRSRTGFLIYLNNAPVYWCSIKK